MKKLNEFLFHATLGLFVILLLIISPVLDLIRLIKREKNVRYD